MIRFITVRITEGANSLESVAQRARAMQVKQGEDKGFELELLTRSKLMLTWFEKVVTERRIDGGLFGIASYEEIRIITFSLILVTSSNDLILIDPPLGKHRVLNVLRALFPTGNFVFLPIDVEKSISSLCQGNGVAVVGIETEPVSVKPNILLSMTASGYGDVVKYLAENHPHRECVFKTAQIESEMRSGGRARVTISATGLVKFTEEVTFEDIESIASRIVFESRIHT